MPSRSFIASTALAAGLVLFSHDALATGGVFTTPADAASTQVTEHRVVLSISEGQTSLWDDLTFSGDPSDFAWVLPVKGPAEIAQSSYYLFQALDQVSTVMTRSPTITCDCAVVSGTGCPLPPGLEQAHVEGVAIVYHEVVGPYETVRLQSTDPQALRTWLSTNGYVVPANIDPVIDEYVAEGFDFLAMRLAPGQTIQDMRPVRVTMPGEHDVLPLRMMASGTGDVAPITLWVFARDRYEPTNMPSFYVDPAELVWDWDSESSNYPALRAAGFEAMNHGGWLIEYARLQDVSWFEVVAIQSGFYAGTPAEREAAAQADHQALAGPFQKYPYSITLTRLRAELPHAALTQDLELAVSATPEEIPELYAPSATGTQPECPPPGTGSSGNGTSGSGVTTSSTGSSSATGSGGAGGADGSGDGSSDGCSFAAPGSHAPEGVGALFALLVAALKRRVRAPALGASATPSSRPTRPRG